MVLSENLDSVIDEVFALADIPPLIAFKFAENYKEIYRNGIVYVSDSIPDIHRYLYEINDDKLYSVVSFLYVDRYVHFLLPFELISGKVKNGSIIKFARETYNLEGKDLGAFVEKLVVPQKALIELLKVSTRSTRRATGYDSNKTIDLPDEKELQRFYECERKHPYESYEETVKDLNLNNHPYMCKHCGHWHQGKQPTGMTVPHNIMLGRWTTAYRRYNNI